MMRARGKGEHRLVSLLEITGVRGINTRLPRIVDPSLSCSILYRPFPRPRPRPVCPFHRDFHQSSPERAAGKR